MMGRRRLHTVRTDSRSLQAFRREWLERRTRRRSRYMEWLAAGLSLSGAGLNGFGMKEGFYLWLPANVLWIVLGVRLRRWGMVATFAAYLVTTVVGILWW